MKAKFFISVKLTFPTANILIIFNNDTDDGVICEKMPIEQRFLKIKY
jgi:hypothetical protein